MVAHGEPDNHFLTAPNETLSCKRATLRLRAKLNDVALNFKGQELQGLHFSNHQALAIFFITTTNEIKGQPA